MSKTPHAAPPEPEFSFVVDIADLPPAGRSYTLKADADQRKRVADRLDLQNVKKLSAAFAVKFAGPGQVSVTGTVDAEVTQTCVVSLCPVPAEIHEAVTATFMSEERAARDLAKAQRAKRRGTKPDEDEVLDPAADDPPEVAKDDRIDLGEVAVVHLALALDPYPRAPGAAFDPKAWGVEEEKAGKFPASSPFAALEKLKKPSKKGKSE